MRAGHRRHGHLGSARADLRLRRRPLAPAGLLRPLPQGLPAGARQPGRQGRGGALPARRPRVQRAGGSGDHRGRPPAAHRGGGAGRHPRPLAAGGDLRLHPRGRRRTRVELTTYSEPKTADRPPAPARRPPLDQAPEQEGAAPAAQDLRGAAEGRAAAGGHRRIRRRQRRPGSAPTYPARKRRVDCPAAWNRPASGGSPRPARRPPCSCPCSPRAESRTRGSTSRRARAWRSTSTASTTTSSSPAS